MKRFRALLASFTLAAFLFLAFLASAQAAIVHAGPSVTGNGSGSDWNNMANFNTLSLVRGNTYYLRGGAYADKTFNTAVSGSTQIIIKKATVADHGSGTGWLDSYAGQAILGNLTFRTSYFTLDGQTRNENNWQQTSSYGFKISGRVDADSTFGAVTNVTVKYTDIGGPAGQICTGSTPSNAFYAVWDNLANWTISRSHLHNVELPIRGVNPNNWIVEYNHIGPSWAKEAISLDNSSGWIVRHNRFIDNLIYPPPACEHGGDGGTADIWTRVTNGQNDNWQVYGNVFGDTGTYNNIVRTNAVILGNYYSGGGDTVSNWKVYNNIFYNIQGDQNLIKLGSGSNNTVANNLWYKSRQSGQSVGIINEGAGATNRTSWCNSTPYNLCPSSPGVWVLGNEDPFQDAANFDFRLKSSFSGPSPVNKGTTLGVGFDALDGLGNTRGADGAWDIGAFERTTGGTPSAPTALRIVP